MRNARAHKLQWSDPTVHSSTVMKYLTLYLLLELLLGQKSMAKNQKLLKTECNNVVGTTLLNVVNNIVRHCYT